QRTADRLRHGDPFVGLSRRSRQKSERLVEAGEEAEPSLLPRDRIQAARRWWGRTAKGRRPFGRRRRWGGWLGWKRRSGWQKVVGTIWIVWIGRPLFHGIPPSRDASMVEEESCARNPLSMPKKRRPREDTMPRS